MSYNPGGGSGSGTVTSVSGTGTVAGLSLTGTVTGAGSITLGGSLSTTSAALTDFNSATRAQTEAMLVAGSGVTLTPGSSGATRTLTIAASGGGGLTFTEVEADLGAAKTGGKFTIAGVGMTTGKPVLINQAVGPYTGKGTRADEAEMDQVSVSASVTSATVITAYWSSPRRVRGNFKFNYAVGA